MKTTYVIGSALIAVSALAALTACSNGDADVTASTPRPTMIATPNPDHVAPTGECVDGAATLTADVETIALPDGCDIVNVLTNASTVTLGPVRQLTIEGNDNTITVATAAKIEMSGEGNTLTHDGAAKVTDHGEENSVKKAS